MTSKIEFKEKIIEYSSLLLNIVQLVRKLVLFECFCYFDQDQRNNLNVKGKNNMNTLPKNIQADLDFSRLIKALINILECEPEGKANKSSAGLDTDSKMIKSQNMKRKGRDSKKNDQNSNL